MSLLYREVSSQIIKYIENHKGITKIPTERELSIRFNVSRQTIRKAISICEEEGIIEKRQGSGMYLTSAYLTRINQIAMIVPDSDDYIYPQLISELENRFKSINYTLVIYNTYDSIKNEGQILDKLLSNPVSSLLIIQSQNALPNPFANKYQMLKQKGTNILFIGNPNPNLTEYSYIKFDDFYSGYNVAKRISNRETNWCAIFVSNMVSSTDRYYGFIQCMADNDYSYDENNIHWITYNQLNEIKKGNNTCIKSILSSYSTVPSVFVCGHDEIAYNVVILLKNTRQINNEMRFFSFENSYVQNITDRNIFFYNGDKEQLCSKIIEMTLNKKNEKEVITLPSSLIHNKR